VPSSVQHRACSSPGAIVQYALQDGRGRVKIQFTASADFEWQAIDDYRVANLGGAQEGPDRLSDQTIDQRGAGVWLLDRMTLGSRWNLLLDVRGDSIHNALTDHLRAGGVDLSGEKDFDKMTGRIGASWMQSERFGVYASVGQGFLPPATEELANNPYQLGGFNMSLVPATPVGEDVGIRGFLSGRFAYDLVYFHLETKNDFGRYRVPWRPLETFYTNAGSSSRDGLEASATWHSAPAFTGRLAYTFSDFRHSTVKSLFGTFTDKVMPNAPRHQGFADAEYLAGDHGVFGLAIQGQSSWYVDHTNTASADGFVLIDPRIVYRLNGRASHTEIILQARNVTGTEYIAFTEPDPDGNSYQPGPTREVFLGARVYVGK
jgi:iron complex outermembrane recepter protein